MIDQPELSPKLIAKLEAAGLDQIAEILSARNRIGLDQIDDLPDFDQNVEWVCPEGYTSPVAEDEQLNYFAVRVSTKALTRLIYFLATADWSRMAVPISLLPPEKLADPILKRWTWIYDNLAGEDECKRLADSIVRRRTGDNSGQQSFTVATPKAEHVFVTTSDWRGLLIPEYIANREPRPQAGFSRYQTFIGKEVTGEKKIRSAALKIAREYDKIKMKDKFDPDAMSMDSRQRYWVSAERLKKLQHTMRFLRATEPHGVIAQSHALGELIDRGFETIPPESEWKRKKPFPWELISGKVGSQE
ncbi:MAG: hypothetical protein P4L67_04620 [Candidatus Pacebacteria bacterium]|nr:hypothetical protein [Candidatus Paceibacterota bacterium]